MNLFLPRILLLVLMAFAGFAVESENKVSIELARATGLYVFVLIVFTIPRLQKKFPFLNGFRIGLDEVAIILLGMIVTQQAIDHAVDTELPRLRAIYRFLYAAFIIFITSPLSRKMGRSRIFLTTVLFFSSFPYHWMYVLSAVKGMPLALYIVQMFFSMDRESLSKLRSTLDPRHLSGFFLMLVPLAFLVANASNYNFFPGIETGLRLFSGLAIILFLIIRTERIGVRAIMKTFLALVVFHLIWFAAPVLLQTIGETSYNPFLDKRTVLSGVNTNDIAGYLIPYFPLLMGLAIFRSKKTYRGLSYAWMMLFVGIFFLLIFTKARAALPIAALVSVLCLSLLWLRRNEYEQDSQRQILHWLRLFGGLGGVLLVVGVFLFANDYFAEITSSRSLRMRFGLWLAAMHSIAASPLSGAGADRFASLSAISFNHFPEIFKLLGRSYRDTGAYIHSHNTYLQLWLDGGPIYLAAILGFISRSLYTGWKNRREMAGFLTIALVGILFQGILNYHWMDYSNWLTLCMIIGLLATVVKHPPITKHDGADDGVRDGADVENENGELSDVAIGMTPKPFLRWILVLLILIPTGYHTIVLAHQARAIDSLRGLRMLNAQNQLVLYRELWKEKDHGQTRNVRRRGGLGVNRAKAVKHSKYALFHAAAAQQLYPWSSVLNQQAGEIAYLLYRNTGKKDYLERSSVYYEKCTLYDPGPYLCHNRLLSIYEILKPSRIELSYRHYQEMRKRDPHRLRDVPLRRPF